MSSHSIASTSPITDFRSASPEVLGERAFTHGTVFAGAVETRYRHIGEGDALILLASAEWSCVPATFDVLAEHFRVIVPSPPAPESPSGSRVLSDWLGPFLDGLGLTRVALVADERLGASALGFALLDDDRVQRLAIVLDGIATNPPDASIRDSLASAGTPLVVIWRQSHHAATAREIVRGLLGQSASAD
jgi:hypothetical protein